MTLLLLPSPTSRTRCSTDTLRVERLSGSKRPTSSTRRLVNSARFGYNRSVHTSIGVKAINPLSANPALGETPGTDNPEIDVPGLTSIQAGVDQATQNDFRSNSFQGYDDVFLTKGIHGLKFGFAVERIQLNLFTYSPGGDFPFGSLVAFLTNQPSTFSGPLQTLPDHLGVRSSIFAGYVQDDVHLRTNLTVNLGLRYEMSTVPTEVRGRLIALRSPTDSTESALGSPIFQNPTLRNFAPRVGFAWDPFRNGKTSIRGGFGMFDVLPLPFHFGSFQANVAPFTLNGTVVNLPPGSFPTEAFNLDAALLTAGTAQRLAYVQPNPKRNYVMQWNLNVQREVMSNLTAMLAYVGSRGVHQTYRSDDINTTLPTLTSAGYLWPSPIGSGKVLSPTVGRMDALTWTNDTFFDGFEAELVKRMSHGFQVQGSYTWSRAIDGGAGSDASDEFLKFTRQLVLLSPKVSARRGGFQCCSESSDQLHLEYPHSRLAPRSRSMDSSRVAAWWHFSDQELGYRLLLS